MAFSGNEPTGSLAARNRLRHRRDLGNCGPRDRDQRDSPPPESTRRDTRVCPRPACRQRIHAVCRWPGDVRATDSRHVANYRVESRRRSIRDSEHTHTRFASSRRPGFRRTAASVRPRGRRRALRQRFPTVLGYGVSARRQRRPLADGVPRRRRRRPWHFRRRLRLTLRDARSEATTLRTRSYGAVRPRSTNAACVTGISFSRNDSAAAAYWRISNCASSLFRSEQKCMRLRGLQLQ